MNDAAIVILLALSVYLNMISVKFREFQQEPSGSYLAALLVHHQRSKVAITELRVDCLKTANSDRIKVRMLNNWLTAVERSHGEHSPHVVEFLVQQLCARWRLWFYIFLQPWSYLELNYFELETNFVTCRRCSSWTVGGVSKRTSSPPVSRTVV